MDRQLGKLFNELNKPEYEDDYTIIITSDHGEAFGEHKMFHHGIRGYREVIHVPLLLHSPDTAFNRFITDTPVQSIDIAPTILTDLNLTIPLGYEGKNILPHKHDSIHPYHAQHHILSENIGKTPNVFFQSFFTIKYKYLVKRSCDDMRIFSEELFDLS